MQRAAVARQAEQRLSAQTQQSCVERKLYALARGENADSVICGATNAAQPQTLGAQIPPRLSAQELDYLRRNAVRLEPEPRKVIETPANPVPPATPNLGVCSTFPGGSTRGGCPTPQELAAARTTRDAESAEAERCGNCTSPSTAFANSSTALELAIVARAPILPSVFVLSSLTTSPFDRPLLARKWAHPGSAARWCCDLPSGGNATLLLTLKGGDYRLAGDQIRKMFQGQRRPLGLARLRASICGRVSWSSVETRA